MLSVLFRISDHLILMCQLSCAFSMLHRFCIATLIFGPIFILIIYPDVGLYVLSPLVIIFYRLLQITALLMRVCVDSQQQELLLEKDWGEIFFHQLESHIFFRCPKYFLANPERRGPFLRPYSEFFLDEFLWVLLRKLWDVLLPLLVWVAWGN